MNTCDTCFFWQKTARYTEGCKKNAIDMICTHGFFDFGENSGNIENDGATVDAYHVSCGNCNFITGPKFGCIHWMKQS